MGERDLSWVCAAQVKEAQQVPPEHGKSVGNGRTNQRVEGARAEREGERDGSAQRKTEDDVKQTHSPTHTPREIEEEGE